MWQKWRLKLTGASINNQEPDKKNVVSSIFDDASQNKQKVSSLLKFPQEKTGTPGALNTNIVTEGLFFPRKNIKKAFPFGVDIGSTSIKIAQFGLSGDGLKLIDLHSENLPESEYGSANKSKDIKETLKKLVQEKKLKGKAYVSIPSSFVTVKNIKIPKMPVKEVKPALIWALKQDPSFDMNDDCFDYIILNEDKIDKAEDYSVLVIIAEKRDIYEQIEIFKAAGIEPLTVETDAFANLATLDFTRQLNRGEVILLLDFGQDDTSLSIVVDKEVQFCRNITVTGNILNESIARKCGISLKEAEKIKQEFGLSEISKEYDEKILNARVALEESTRELIVDVEHTFKYFSYQLTKSEIRNFDRIIVTGGSSLLKGFSKTLHESFKVPVDFIKPVDVKYVESENNPKYVSLKDCTGLFSVAIGLALTNIKY